MALQFSHVRVSAPDGNEAEFLVSGIPREFDDFEYYTAFEDFLDGTRYGGFMYVSYWHSGDDYYIDNETEFEDRLANQGMTMGGM